MHEDYLAELDNPDMGLTNVHPSVIYQHIIDRCAKIDLRMADDNHKQFNTTMDSYKPLAVYTKKQEHCQAFAADVGNPISMADGANGVTHAVATRVMHKAYREWKRIPKVEQTWNREKEHFNDAFNELKEINAITAESWDMGPTKLVMQLWHLMLQWHLTTLHQRQWQK